MGEVPDASPSRMTALKPAGEDGAASSSEAMAASRAAADAPVTRVVATPARKPGNQTPFLASLPGSTPSCLSLRYRWVRSRPVFSATRVMLPPSRPR